jgi:hypothetical protein
MIVDPVAFAISHPERSTAPGRRVMMATLPSLYSPSWKRFVDGADTDAERLSVAFSSASHRPCPRE